MHLFNWYVLNDNVLCGDLCIHHGIMYHEYLLFQQQRKSSTKRTAPHDPDREHRFVQVPITSSHVDDDGVWSCKTNKYTQPFVLVNMDGYFGYDDVRRELQYSKLRGIIS
jgi:hypothetical protein